MTMFNHVSGDRMLKFLTCQTCATETKQDENWRMFTQTSEINRSACFKSSPMTKTVDVVPSPVISSMAVDALAIREAVGC